MLEYTGPYDGYFFINSHDMYIVQHVQKISIIIVANSFNNLLTTKLKTKFYYFLRTNL